MLNFLSGFRWPALLLLPFLAACNSSKFLAEEQEILVKQQVVIDNKKEIKNASELNYQLSTLARQQPNTNFLFLFPREYIYLSSNRAKDSTRFDRFKRNALGQPPAIYNDSLTQLTIEDMETFLIYRGYLRAEAYTDLDHLKRQRIGVTYHVNTGPRTLIDSVSYSSPQPDIDSILQTELPNSFLQPNDPLNLTLFDKEKERLGRLLRNKGYAFFTNTYFEQLRVITFRRPGFADLSLQISPPRSDEYHQRYKVGTVDVYGDFQAGDIIEPFGLDTIVEGIRFRFLGSEPKVKIDALLDNIFLRPGEFYSKDAVDKTNEQLGLLGIYRFVRIGSQIDPNDEGLLNFSLQLTPNEQMEVGLDFDLNYTNRINNTGATNLIGLSLSPSFNHRNLLGGGELFTTNIRGGVEFNPNFSSNENLFINTVDFGTELSVYLPRFRDYLGMYKFLYNVPLTKDKHLLNERFYNGLQDRASTRLSVAYEYLLIRDFYAYTLADVRYGYNYQRSATSSYGITHLALDVLVPSTQPRFDSILAENQFLQLSFGEQFFASLLFRELQYQRTGRPNLRGQSLTVIGDFELAGLEILGLNRLYNALWNNDIVFRPRRNASYAQFWRLEGDVRFNQQYNPETSLVGRFNIGIGRPFGFGAAVPYVKQFFVGGANSMRAWAPRGLGPGGYVDPESLDPQNNLRLFQTGDFKLELNLEYRFKLLWQLRGAFFVDVGNIWSLNSDPDRCGSQLLFRSSEINCSNGTTLRAQPFYRQLAIGSGFGVRIDLSYFIFRLDMAIPLRYNFPSLSGNRDSFQGPSDDPRVIDGIDLRESHYWNQFDEFRLRDFTFQLGLGYPF
ncbi:MAG: BamA/TamA family outer membrane protein [Bacteroidota bacterium]